MNSRLARLREQHDWLRRSLVNEPRGSDRMVGALLCESEAADCEAGLIFFNNAGYLGMCGHGTMGAVVSLAWLGRAEVGVRRFETVVGAVTTELHEDGSVSVRNVPSSRHLNNVTVDVPGFGSIVGDVAWGGNWFFLVSEHGQALLRSRVDELTRLSTEIRAALHAGGIRGADGSEIDHIELFGPPSSGEADSRNFVLCPGGAYDRSPCGTGTSAKIACLAEDGQLPEGATWRQESIVGSVFEARYEYSQGGVIPTIRGTAFVTADVTLVTNPRDPFTYGISEDPPPERLSPSDGGTS